MEITEQMIRDAERALSRHNGAISVPELAHELIVTETEALAVLGEAQMAYNWVPLGVDKAGERLFGPEAE